MKIAAYIKTLYCNVEHRKHFPDYLGQCVSCECVLKLNSQIRADQADDCHNIGLYNFSRKRAGRR